MLVPLAPACTHVPTFSMVGSVLVPPGTEMECCPAGASSVKVRPLRLPQHAPLADRDVIAPRPRRVAGEVEGAAEVDAPLGR